MKISGQLSAEINNAVFNRMRLFGRMALCGMISNYNTEGSIPSPDDFGRIQWKDHIVEGIAQAPSALQLIFSGKNEGKLIVQLPTCNAVRAGRARGPLRSRPPGQISRRALARVRASAHRPRRAPCRSDSGLPTRRGTASHRQARRYPSPCGAATATSSACRFPDPTDRR